MSYEGQLPSFSGALSTISKSLVIFFGSSPWQRARARLRPVQPGELCPVACAAPAPSPAPRVRARRSADALLLLQPDWNVQDVQDFLARCASKLGNRMQSYQQLVAENDIDGEVLEVLEDDDLKRLGIKSLGHRCVASRVRQWALYARPQGHTLPGPRDS
jgi:hypothetical protein